MKTSVWQQQRRQWCDGQWAMDARLLEYHINEEILEEGRVEPKAVVPRRRMVQWLLGRMEQQTAEKLLK